VFWKPESSAAANAATAPPGGPKATTPGTRFDGDGQSLPLQKLGEALALHFREDHRAEHLAIRRRRL